MLYCWSAGFRIGCGYGFVFGFVFVFGFGFGFDSDVRLRVGFQSGDVALCFYYHTSSTFFILGGEAITPSP